MAALAVNRDQIEEVLALQAIFGQDFHLNTDIQLPDSSEVLPEASTSYGGESLAFQLTVHPELTGMVHIQVMCSPNLCLLQEKAAVLLQEGISNKCCEQSAAQLELQLRPIKTNPSRANCE